MIHGSHRSHRKTAVAAALIAAATLVQGCAYTAARGRDFTDVLSLGISGGGGLGARATATRLVALELGAQKDEKLVGWRERNFGWVESSYGLLFASWRQPSLDEEPLPEKSPFQLITTSQRRNFFPARTEVEETRHIFFILAGARGVRPVTALDVGVGLSALIAGLEVTVSPGELVDFLLGWFGVDIGRDDDVRFGDKRQEFPKPQR
jgi:hypothetical protein